MFKNIILASLSFLALACGPPQPKESIVIGMGLALTGHMAEYGQAVKRGVELALEEVNAAGGIHGQPLEIDFQDDQYDPKQAVAIAQRFIANPKVLLTSAIGTVPAMSVRSLCQKAGLTLFAFNTALSEVVQEGDYVWSNFPLLSKRAAFLAQYVQDIGCQKVAIFVLTNDFTKSLSDQIVEILSKVGVQVVLRETYLPGEKDFRPLISKAKAQDVDGYVLASFLSDAALLVQQIRKQGLEQPVFVHGSVASAGTKFPQLAGAAAEGVYIAGDFFLDDPRPEVVNFMKKWKDKYPQEKADQASVHAYDSIILAAEVLKLSDGTRASVKKAFAQVKDVPSVIYGKVRFNPTTRLVDSFLGARLVVQDGQLVRYEPAKPKE